MILGGRDYQLLFCNHRNQRKIIRKLAVYVKENCRLKLEQRVYTVRYVQCNNPMKYRCDKYKILILIVSNNIHCKHECVQRNHNILNRIHIAENMQNIYTEWYFISASNRI